MPSRKPFEIGGETIAPGTRKTVHLPISVLPDHTQVTMSAHVVHGKKDGPTIFISAGVHGDEIIGVEIVRRILARPSLKSLRGTLIAVPIVNAFGFFNQSRYLPDRRDLNRCFPGSRKGSLASRLADKFLREIVERCDLGIDLHSAAAYRVNLPQIRISPDNSETARLAKVFGAPVILQSPLREGSLRGEAKEKGVDVLLFEAGEALRFDEVYVRAGVVGILRIMKDLGMIANKRIAPPKSEPLLCPSSKWVRASQGGLLRAFKAEGDIVANGELLAMVADPFGTTEHEIRAPLAGIIVGRVVKTVVNEGDALFHVARVGKDDDAGRTMDALVGQLEDDPLFDEDEIT